MSISRSDYIRVNVPLLCQTSRSCRESSTLPYPHPNLSSQLPLHSLQIVDTVLRTNQSPSSSRVGLLNTAIKLHVSVTIIMLRAKSPFKKRTPKIDDSNEVPATNGPPFHHYSSIREFQDLQRQQHQLNSNAWAQQKVRSRTNSVRGCSHFRRHAAEN
jgi:hypothetical protein